VVHRIVHRIVQEIPEMRDARQGREMGKRLIELWAFGLVLSALLAYVFIKMVGALRNR
jgi:hypothetical protein